MDLSSLKPAKGSIKKGKRIARGQGSGSAGTAGRGHKGAKSRSGYKYRPRFEGGQMPLQRRIPKFGFKNHNSISYVVINLKDIERVSEKTGKDTLTLEDFLTHGIISKKDKLKILGDGKLSAKITVDAHAASKSARESIEQTGGTVNIIS
jgi:large subunit ribosomal protein L15